MGISRLRKDEAQSLTVEEGADHKDEQPDTGCNPGAFFRQNMSFQKDDQRPAQNQSSQAAPYAAIGTKQSAAP